MSGKTARFFTYYGTVAVLDPAKVLQVRARNRGTSANLDVRQDDGTVKTIPVRCPAKVAENYLERMRAK